MKDCFYGHILRQFKFVIWSKKSKRGLSRLIGLSCLAKFFAMKPPTPLMKRNFFNARGFTLTGRYRWRNLNGLCFIFSKNILAKTQQFACGPVFFRSPNHQWKWMLNMEISG